MEHLPSELLEEIFSLCCNDGGNTGCSLALVSKHIRAASRTSRFYSIALCSGSASQLRRFLSLLNTERAVDSPLKPRVRHLYIASPETHMDNFLTSYYRHGSRRPAEEERLADQYGQERIDFITSISLLLRTVAAEVETLCLAQSGNGCRWTTEIPLYVPEAECGEFPALRELTIVGSGMTFSNAYTKDFVVYPRLSRLHLVAAATRLERWTARAPNISHLCVSDERGHMYQEVARVVHRDPEDTSVVFVQLKHFVVQPYGSGRQPGGAAVLQPWDAHASEFNEWQLGWLKRNAVHPFHLRPTKLLPGSDGSWEEITLREWLDRLDGGDGCWTK